VHNNNAQNQELLGTTCEIHIKYQ